MVNLPVEIAGELWSRALSWSIYGTRSGVMSYLCHTGWELSKQYCVATYQSTEQNLRPYFFN